MKKDVLVRVRGEQVSAEQEDQEPIELVVPGQYYMKNGVHYLRYEEHMEDFAESTVNYIKYGAHKMEVRKQGLIHTNMIFEKGKRTQAFYTTPYGTMEMGLTSSVLQIQEQENHISMKVQYAMDIHEEHAADCDLTIDIYEKGTTEFRL